MKYITELEMNEQMRKHKSGSIVLQTEKAINLEFYDGKLKSMVKKWIPKSAIISSIVVVPDNSGGFGFVLDILGHPKLKIGDTVWLRLNEWAYKKIILGMEGLNYYKKADYSDLEMEEDQDFRMVYGI